MLITHYDNITIENAIIDHTRSGNFERIIICPRRQHVFRDFNRAWITNCFDRATCGYETHEWNLNSAAFMVAECLNGATFPLFCCEKVLFTQIRDVLVDCRDGNTKMVRDFRKRGGVAAL